MKTKSDEKAFRKYIIMLEELSTNRNLLEFIKKGEDMLSQINYETLPSFYIGLEKGEIRGIEKGKLEGEKQKAIEIAKNLIDILDIETISNKTGLSIEDIRNLL